MNEEHMDHEEFRRRAHELIDWIVDYRKDIERHPVLAKVKPGEILDALPTDPPETGEDFDAVFADFERVVMPGITHWQSPNWFAFFPSNASYPSMLGEMLSGGLAVQGMLWVTSPACTELEQRVMDWTADLLGLPDKFRFDGGGGGVIQDTASSAVLCALVAARERATGGASNRDGCDGRLVAYTSVQAHSSLEKAVGIAGIGRDNLRLIEVDDAFAMRPDAFAARVAADKAAGLVPFFACATVGTTASNAIDPVQRIGEICTEHDIWLHVDAAMSGTAAVCPELRWIHDGVELADSYNFNPHKWMLTHFDCSAFWVADRERLVSALSILPDYLRNQATDAGAVVDYRDWHVQLGRRFRALKLWFVIRHYGAEGIRAMVREHVRLTQRVVARIEASDRFELVAPVPLNLLCFRIRGGDDAANRELLERVNATGKIYLSHCVLDGRYTLRFCIGQMNTTEAHVDAAWDLIEKTVRGA